MTKTEKAVTWAIEIANDPAHGYDQDNRWGPDYDCSSLVISAWQQAGVPVKTKGATYTGNMKSVFLSCGFKDVTSKVNLSTGSGMKRGDVLLNIASHTVMHIGNGQVVSASKNENNGYHGGKPGDQSGKEIKLQSYYNFPWDCVLRYTEDSSTTDPDPETQPTAGNAKIRKGQGYANKFANAGISITGKRDAATKKAGVKVLQTALNRDYGAGLDVDGIWGTNTDNALGQHYVKNGETQYMVTAAEILLLLRAYDPNGVEIPGTFGSGLLSAVKAFQKAQGLTVSGTCDRNTFLKLIS